MTDQAASDERTLLTVSVMVPTFRRLDMLQRCLAGVEALEYPVRDVIVVYRPDVDPETARWLETERADHPKWILVPIDRAGQVSALNLGLDRATGDIVAIFDDDAIPKPGWLTKIVEHFRRPDVAAAGGRDRINPDVEPVVDLDCPQAGRRNFWGILVGHHHEVAGPPRDVDVVKGCNWALRRAAIGSLTFDPRLLGSGAQIGNDYWFCLNLRHAGWKTVLDPRAIVDHYPAKRSDIDRSTWSAARCREQTCNNTALEMAFTGVSLKIRYLLFHVLVGSRACPGLYFIAHSVAKRPRDLPGQLEGGWGGMIEGFRLAWDFARNPRGLPRPCPTLNRPRQ